jgi:hypothetical protein
MNIGDDEPRNNGFVRRINETGATGAVGEWREDCLNTYPFDQYVRRFGLGRLRQYNATLDEG